MDLHALITTPIEGDSPTGADINYDPDFDVLKAEVGKMGNIDNDLIERVALVILRDKSKDLRVLAFLSFAALRKQKWDALADVFAGVTHLAENHFDAVHPVRPRARENAFRWLSENRFTDALEGAAPAEADHEQVRRLVEALNKLKGILEEKFPETAVFPQRLFAKAGQWEKSTKPKPVETQTATVAPKPAGGQAEPMETPKQAQGVARKAALVLIEQEPKKSMGYRLLCAARWDLLEKAPPATDGRTHIPAPQQQQRDFFKGLVAAQEWSKAIPATQKAFASGGNHCWLDLQRIAATACEALGDEWSGVREAIEHETALVAERLPDIVDLCFADGSRFCEDATRDWIDTIRAARSTNTHGGPAAAIEDPVAEERKAANALVAGGKIDQALVMVQQGVNSSINERDRFRRGLMLCGLLLGAGRVDMALGILDTLEQRIESHRLDSWDPDLAVEAWRMTYEACGKAGGGDAQAKAAMSSRRQELLRKISCVDPKTAFTLGT